MARKRRVDPGRDLLDLIANHSQDASRQVLPQLDTGQVILVEDGTDGTVVQLDNMSVAASDCILLGSYTPVVGDRVMVLVHREDFWIIGGIQGQSTGSSGSPSGAAGGDLSGTYPNPTLSPTIALQLHQTGMMMMWAGATPPSGWLVLDGSSQLRATYPTLSTFLLAQGWGSVDGTHFNLPDFRGRGPMGVGTGDATGATAHALRDKPTTGSGGEETHTLLAIELATHNHGGGTNGFLAAAPTITTGTPSVASTGAGTSHTHTFTGTVHGHTPFGGVTYTGGAGIGTNSTGGGTADRLMAGNAGTGVSGVTQSAGSINDATAGGTNAAEAAHTHSMQAHTHSSTMPAHDHVVQFDGSSTPHNIVQPSLTVNFIIKT